MTLIDWMMEHPYLAAALIAYALVTIITTRANISISISFGGRFCDREKKDSTGG